MKLPLQITWRDVPQSEALEIAIRNKAEKLEQFSEQIMSCHVVVETSERRQHQGKLYRLHIRIKVPDKEIVITRDPAKNHSHEDMYVAIRDAFAAARRQLQDYMRRRQGKIKPHDITHEARIVRLFPQEGHGFIQAPNGEEVYFHRNAVINADFDLLQVGEIVRFVEEMGDQGPQAKQVSLPGHHGRKVSTKSKSEAET